MRVKKSLFKDLTCEKLDLLQSKYTFTQSDYIEAGKIAVEQSDVELCLRISREIGNEILDIAAEQDNPSLIYQLIEKNPELKVSEYVTWFAIKNGNLELVKWLSLNGGYHDCGVHALRLAIMSNNIELINYLETILHHKYDQGALDNAAEIGNFDLLKRLVNEGIRSTTCAAAAARGGQLEILKWLWEEKEGVFNDIVFALAPESGNLELCKWLYENGCPTSSSAYIFAIDSGSIDIVRYLIDIKCPYDDYILDYAKKMKTTKIHEILLEFKS